MRRGGRCDGVTYGKEAGARGVEHRFQAVIVWCQSFESDAVRMFVTSITLHLFGLELHDTRQKHIHADVQQDCIDVTTLEPLLSYNADSAST